MKKHILLLALTLISYSAMAETKAKTKGKPAEKVAVASKPVPLPSLSDDEFALFDKDHYKKFTVTEVDGLKLDSSCKNKSGKPDCMAYKTALSGEPQHESGAFNGSPASQFCSDLGGSNLIALNSKKQEFNFCEFKDGSLVNSWSLFYKRNPKKVIK